MGERPNTVAQMTKSSFCKRRPQLQAEILIRVAGSRDPDRARRRSPELALNLSALFLPSASGPSSTPANSSSSFLPNGLCIASNKRECRRARSRREDLRRRLSNRRQSTRICFRGLPRFRTRPPAARRPRSLKWTLYRPERARARPGTSPARRRPASLAICSGPCWVPPCAQKDGEGAGCLVLPHVPTHFFCVTDKLC